MVETELGTVIRSDDVICIISDDYMDTVDKLWISALIFSYGEMTFYAMRVDKFGRWLTIILRISRMVRKCVVYWGKLVGMENALVLVPVGIVCQLTRRI